MKESEIHIEMVELLQDLIRIKSYSGQEEGTAQHVEDFLQGKGLRTERKYHNIWVKNKFFDPGLPTVLLNSHHDTVKPASTYTRDPFDPRMEEGRLYGLGSNDAGAALVSLLGVFLGFYHRNDLPINLIFAATAEEETSGPKGIESILPDLPTIDFAIVGEPTSLQMATAEKGLLVIDVVYKGKAGHAARKEGDNAIYKVIDDLTWFKNYRFDKISELLGPVLMNVTQIEAGTQHNVVPDECRLVVDVRCTDAYSLAEILGIIDKNTTGDVRARSKRLQPSFLDPGHPILTAAAALEIPTYGSPTLSDQSLMPFPSVKIGPGDSERSHTADEFVHVEAIGSAIELYKKILMHIKLDQTDDIK